jgi:alpha/beta superfamily hydrolase
VGFNTLRFNFRGVGSSSGEHDEGRGEVEDFAAAAAWLRGVAFGLPLFAVGFSFGSWCAIRHAVRDTTIDAVVAIGLPVRTYAFAEIARLRRPFAVVQASDDEFGSPQQVRETIDGAEPAGVVHVVEGTTHLFPKRAPDAGRVVADAATTLLDRLG